MEAGSPQLVSIKKAPPPAIHQRSGNGADPRLLSGSKRDPHEASGQSSGYASGQASGYASGQASGYTSGHASGYTSGPPRASARNSAAAGDGTDDHLFTMSSPDLGSASFDDTAQRKGYRFRVKKKKRSEVDSSRQSQTEVNGFISQPDLRAARDQNVKRLMKVEVIEVEDAPVAPATSVRTTRADAKVQLRMSDAGLGAQKPITVHSMFADTVRKYPYSNALAYKPDPKGKEYEFLTYIEYYRLCVQAAKALIKLGLQPYHSVGILGFNCVEWFVSDMAAIFAGGFACGIYTTNSAETCEYIAANSSAQVIMVEDAAQAKKILSVRKNLPKLLAVVQWKGDVADDPILMSWQTFLELGKDEKDDIVAQRLKDQAPNQCCTLIYTSGTTGNPKGVMLSHDNMTWTSRATADYVGLQPQAEVVVSYLPLSHVAAQVVDILGMMCVGGTVYFAQADALKGSLGVTLREARPTIFLGVPRVWEKMQEKMLEIGRTLSGTKKKISRWAKGVGYRGSVAQMKGESLPWGWTLANLLVFNRLKRTLGLDRCRMCVTAAAPITKETLDYFMSLTLPLLEVYGMSESSGPHTLSNLQKFRATAVGITPPGFCTKLKNPDDDGNGEVCMRSRNVFMGYLNDEKNTNESMDNDGWLFSGDVGKEDKDGFIYITGRIKEILITAGGENVAPVPIEDKVKEALPCLSNAMLLGDKRKFLSILLTFKTEVNEEGEPLDKLTPAAMEWLQQNAGCSADVKTVQQVVSLAEDATSPLSKAITAGIDRANQASVSRASRVQKWKILTKDFSLPGGELGPTMKLRRPIVSKKYSSVIEELYRE